MSVCSTFPLLRQRIRDTFFGRVANPEGDHVFTEAGDFEVDGEGLDA
jgi:hypothetical protein